MIEAIKQKLKNAWLWLKRKVKRVLIILGIIGTVMAAGNSLITTDLDISIDKISQKYDSSQIKQEYQLIDGVRLKKVIKDDWRDRIMVEVGKKKQVFQQGIFGGKSLEVFTPSLKMTRWDEVDFELDPEPIIGSIPLKNRKLNFIGKKIKYTTSKKELHFYNIEPNEKLREGGYEFEVILKEKPSTNKLEFTIKTKGLKFYYQPPMTEEKLEEGQTADETHIYDKDGNVIAERPENVVGSYAVYHATKGAMSNVKGGKLYRVGKAFHIYRPKITDANGNWTWGKLNIDEKKGILTIEIDQDFLDKAVYPVKVDPTFGYDTLGSSGTAILYSGGGYRRGGNYDCPEAGTLEKITADICAYSGESGTIDVTVFVNDEDSEGSNSHGEVAKKETTSLSITDQHTWFDFTTNNESLSQDTYILNAVGGPDSLEDALIGYDSGSTKHWYSESGSYTTLRDENPWTVTDSDLDFNVSIYCTYTLPGPSVTTNAVSSIKDTEATGNGNVTAINDTSITERGFVWDTSSKSKPGDVAPTSSGYANYTNETGTFSTGTFSLTLSSLTEGTTYYVRAYAKNNDGHYGYGDEVTFIAGEIKRIDTTNDDFGAGTYSSTTASNNNLELEKNITLQDTESFETGFGDWQNVAGNDEDWTRNSGSTPSSGTGPSSAYDGDYYIYVETSSGHAYYSGDTSIVEYDLGGTYNGYVDFYYHQYGADQGTLYLEKYDGSSWTTIWSSSGDQGNQWNHVTTPDTDFTGAQKLRFRNVAAGGYQGDVALDLIKVYTGSGSGYKTSGTYESATMDISKLYSADDSEISWNATLNGQSLTVKTRYSTDGGSNWSSWATATNGGAMSGVGSIGTNTSNALVQYRVEMSGDGSNTPQLHDITMRVMYEEGGGGEEGPKMQSIIIE